MNRPTPRVECTSCGSFVPPNTPTEIRSGTAVKECARCGFGVDLGEGIVDG